MTLRLSQYCRLRCCSAVPSSMSGKVAGRTKQEPQRHNPCIERRWRHLGIGHMKLIGAQIIRSRSGVIFSCVLGTSCLTIEKPQSSDRFAGSQNAYAQSQRTTPATSTIAAAQRLRPRAYCLSLSAVQRMALSQIACWVRRSRLHPPAIGASRCKTVCSATPSAT